MTTTYALPPTADLAGSWELVNPVPFAGTGYTEPRVIGSDGAGYQAGDGKAAATQAAMELPVIFTPPGEISFVGASHIYTSSAATTLAVPYPTQTILSGDVMEVIVSTQEIWSNDPGVPTMPAGWTQAWTVSSTSQYRPHLTKFWKTATGGESGTVLVTWGASTSNHVGTMMVWRGVDPISPHDDTGYESGAPPVRFGYSSNPNPTDTDVGVDGAVVQAIAAGNRGSASTATLSSGYLTAIKGAQESPHYRSFAIGYRQEPVGEPNPGSYTWNRSYWTAVTDVLRPTSGQTMLLVFTSVNDALGTGQVGTAPVLAANNEEQTLTADQGLGSFTLTFDGQTTASISSTATANAVQTALEALSNVAVNDVAVDGGPLKTAPVRVTFQGAYEFQNVPLMETNEDDDLLIETTIRASPEQTFTFEQTVNVPQGGTFPQLHMWSLPLTTGFNAGRQIEITAADHDDLDSWAAVLLVMENVDPAALPSATSAGTTGASKEAAFGEITPPDHGAKILSVVAKALAATYRVNQPWPSRSYVTPTVAPAVPNGVEYLIRPDANSQPDWDAAKASIDADTNRGGHVIRFLAGDHNGEYRLRGGNTVGGGGGDYNGVSGLHNWITCNPGAVLRQEGGAGGYPTISIEATDFWNVVGCNFDGSDFQHIRFMHVRGDAGSRCLIAGNTLANFQHAGIKVRGWHVSPWSDSAYVDVVGNIIDGAHASRTTPEYGEGIYIGHGGTEWVDTTHDILISQNRISNCQSDSIETKVGTDNITVSFNEIWGGRLVEGSGGTSIPVGHLSINYANTAEPGGDNAVTIDVIGNRLWDMQQDTGATIRPPILLGRGGINCHSNLVWASEAVTAIEINSGAGGMGTGTITVSHTTTDAASAVTNVDSYGSLTVANNIPDQFAATFVGPTTGTAENAYLQGPGSGFALTSHHGQATGAGQVDATGTAPGDTPDPGALATLTHLPRYSTWPGSAPIPTGPRGYLGYHGTGDRTTLSAFFSGPVAASAITPSTARWVTASEQWTTFSVAVKPVVASASAANLYSVLADNNDTSWVELGGALGQMFEVLEFDLSGLPGGAYITEAKIRFTHESDKLNPLRVYLVGIRPDDSIIPGVEHTTYVPSLVNSAEVVETQPWSSLTDGSPLFEHTRLGVAFRSSTVAPGVTTHRIYEAELVLEVELGGPTIQGPVVGPAVNGDPVSWTYFSSAGYPQIGYQIMVIQGVEQSPLTAVPAADTLMAATGEIIYDSGLVYSTSARSHIVPYPLGRNTMTYAVRCYTEFASGLIAPSLWKTASVDLPGPYPAGPSLTTLHFENFPTDGPAETVLGSEWILYDDDSPGHGWGRRRPEAIAVVTEGTANNGHALRVTATNGTGPDAGFIVSGGLKLDESFIYKQVEMRVRIQADPDEVTNGVCILWPDDDAILFPGGVNPAGGEMDMWETWANRSTRNPVKTNLHRLTPGAVPPYDPRPSADDQLLSFSHSVDGSAWRKFVFDWWKDELRLTIDNAAKPLILTQDGAWSPDWLHRLTFQLDAFPNPSTPTTEPLLTSGDVTMDLDYLVVRNYGPNPVFDPIPGTVSMEITTPAAVSRAWLQRSSDQGATWQFTPDSPYTVAPSTAGVVLVDGAPAFNADIRYRLTFDAGPMSESSVPMMVGTGEINTSAEGWYLQNPVDSSMNMRIEVAQVKITVRQRSVVTEGSGGAVVARSRRLGDVIQVQVRTRNKAERLALDRILDARITMRLVDVLGREWLVSQVDDRELQLLRVQPLPTETTGLRDFHTTSLVFREVLS